MRIAIVAGEVSGDILGARLIESLKDLYPHATFEGIAGPEMQAAGCASLYAMDRLSVMGFSEVVSRLFELLSIRRQLLKRWKQNPPDLFIGIDAPDFNLRLEKKLHHAGNLAVHYVSPSVWAWRQSRVKKMIGNMDLMLTLLPFEVGFYKKHQIPAEFVGHPLADEIPLEVNQLAARKLLGLPEEKFILAVLPGSRMGEIKRIASDFLEGISILHQSHPDWLFVVPLVNDKIKKAFDQLKQEIAPEVPLVYVDGQSRQVMEASDQILMASGTAVLEGMLINRPMVAGYRMATFTVSIIRLFKMIKTPFVTLPNNLAGEYLVPELLQEDLSKENIVREVEKQYCQAEEHRQYMQNRFLEIHQQLRQNASQRAAQALKGLFESRGME